MHCISIQIHPDYSKNFDTANFLSRVRPIRSPEVDAITEGNKCFLSFHFFTEQPAQLWQKLSLCLYKDSHYGALLSPISIVLSEDESGVDCRLLHHFDPSEKLDQLD
jgi:hypothetical protein